MQQSDQRYNFVARQFHWFAVPVLIAIFSLGVVMTGLPLSSLKLSFYAWHKWLGISLLVLMLARLIWRFVSVSPVHRAASGVPPYIDILSKLGHFAVYGLLLVVPLIGWMRSSTAGFKIVLFELIPLPDFMSKDEVLSKLLAQLHWIGAGLLFLALVGHIGAVVMHHVAWRDQVLDKMQPARVHLLFVGLASLCGIALMANFLVLNPPQKLRKKTTEKVAAAVKSDVVTEKSSVSGEWSLDMVVSKLEFTATQSGSPTTGVFKELVLKQLVFSKAAPETSMVEIEIPILSLSLSNTMVEQTLLYSDWFDQETYPTGSFKAKGFKPLGDDKYKLDGTLTIKDIAKPLSVTLTIVETKLAETGQIRLTAKGTTSFSRLSYKIGQGEWASTEMLADKITLLIDVAAIKAQ